MESIIMWMIESGSTNKISLLSIQTYCVVNIMTTPENHRYQIGNFLAVVMRDGWSPFLLKDEKFDARPLCERNESPRMPMYRMLCGPVPMLILIRQSILGPHHLFDLRTHFTTFIGVKTKNRIPCSSHSHRFAFYAQYWFETDGSHRFQLWGILQIAMRQTWNGCRGAQWKSSNLLCTLRFEMEIYNLLSHNEFGSASQKPVLVPCAPKLQSCGEVMCMSIYTSVSFQKCCFVVNPCVYKRVPLCISSAWFNKTFV